MDINNILTNLNLSKTSSKSYLALLELGKATADGIAKRANTYKANVYDSMEKLANLGLITSISEDNKTIFIPTNPGKLPQIIEDQKEQEINRLDELKKDINVAMPNLLARYNTVKEKDLFEVYRGKKAYKSIIKEILESKPKYWKGFGNFQVLDAFPIDFFKWFKKVNFRLFSTKSNEIKKKMEEAKKGVNVRVTWLPKEIYMPIVWVVFGENVLIIIYEPDLIVLRIKSDQVVKTFSNQFNYLWKKYNKTELI